MISEQDFNKIFASNLNYYLNLHDRTQSDLAKYVGVSTASVSNWCKGIKLPRMDKVDKMCSFFNIQRNDLMLEKSSQTSDSISSAKQQRPLTPDQEQLLDDYNRLNDYGKEKVREYASDLTEQDKYKKQHAAQRIAPAAG